MKPKTVRRAHPLVASLAKSAQNIENIGETQPSGFAAGSFVLTMQGEKPVEQLRPGERLITRDIGMVRLKSITCSPSPTAYRIRASVLGHDRPAVALLVAQGQRLLLRDWRAKAMFGASEALVPVARLVDGHFIRRETDTRALFYALEFDSPHILYVEGLEVASAAPNLIKAQPDKKLAV